MITLKPINGEIIPINQGSLYFYAGVQVINPPEGGRVVSEWLPHWAYSNWMSGYELPPEWRLHWKSTTIGRPPGYYPYNNYSIPEGTGESISLYFPHKDWIDTGTYGSGSSYGAAYVMRISVYDASDELVAYDMFQVTSWGGISKVKKYPNSEPLSVTVSKEGLSTAYLNTKLIFEGLDNEDTYDILLTAYIGTPSVETEVGSFVHTIRPGIYYSLSNEFVVPSDKVLPEGNYPATVYAYYIGESNIYFLTQHTRNNALYVFKPVSTKPVYISKVTVPNLVSMGSEIAITAHIEPQNSELQTFKVGISLGKEGVVWYDRGYYTDGYGEFYSFQGNNAFIYEATRTMTVPNDSNISDVFVRVYDQNNVVLVEYVANNILTVV